MRRKAKIARAWPPILLAFGLIALATCSRQRLDAQCDTTALEARAPDLDAVRLDDEALLELGGDALADIIENCAAIDPWTKHALHSRGSSLTPRITAPRSTNPEEPPASVTAQARRTCPSRHGQFGEILDLGKRARDYAIFDACEFEKRGVLNSNDTAYLDPQELADWRVHQMLLESNVSEDLSRRYFIAILLGLEIEQRAAAVVRVHDGTLDFTLGHAAPQIATIRADGRLDEAASSKLALALADTFEMTSGCIVGRVTISGTEPIGHLRWLFDADTSGSCSDGTLTIAIFEREQLLRPLRADLDAPVSGRGQSPDLELGIDSSGAWRTDDGAARGSTPVELGALLDRRDPSSIRVRTNASTPAAMVIDLLRVPDVWRARQRKNLKLWLRIEAPET